MGKATNGVMTAETIKAAMAARETMLTSLRDDERDLLAQLADLREQMRELGSGASAAGRALSKGSVIERVLGIVVENGPLPPREIIARIGPASAGSQSHPVYTALQRLVSSGRVMRDGDGNYSAA